MSAEGSKLRETVRLLPGMDRLLPALEDLPPAYLVGGAVRDLLRGERGLDLDLAVESDALGTAGKLAARLGGEVRSHERFGTATVEAEGLSFDVAQTRRERYERPGALPTVEPAPLAEDLRRRDFTINAMAIALAGDRLGQLHDPQHGLDDLRSGSVRVLHEGSFEDDPTRLLRAVRYERRLGYEMDPDTERLAREALAGGALGTVSPERVRDVLLRLLADPDAPGAVERMHALGLDTALHPALHADPELAASAALGAAAIGADRALSSLAALVSTSPRELLGWANELGLPASRFDRVGRAAVDGPRLAAELRSDMRPSELYDLLAGEPPEALALALASGAPAEPVLCWVTELSAVRLEVSGEDLLAAGMEQGPQVGRALAQALRRKLDGELDGREEELAAALESME